MGFALLFSLLLIQHFNQDGPAGKKYACFVQRSSERLPQGTKGISILLKAMGQAAMREELIWNQTVAVFQCSDAHGPVQVHLIVSEVMHRGSPEARPLLQSLKLIADQDTEDCAGTCCLEPADHQGSLQSQAEVHVTGKALLPGASNCAISSPLTKSGGATGRATNGTSDSRPCADELRNRKKKAIFFKVLILSALVPVMLAILMFVICKVPCLFPCFRCMLRSKIVQKRFTTGKEKKKEADTDLATPGTSTMVWRHRSVMLSPSNWRGLLIRRVPQCRH
ncbi:uncharacterized protein C17orf78 homolog isoform X2 [Hemicordylus capensis]|uniref:uncharacterized protein C17orf78 homolog isoform X2 n=1 Tax=Hemicordylus capensis TaxID=884348 RepID=UPI0023025CCE|nr:uncharacterized protein C17orf78 homolog isoform X2 [Hemicordylus capensis]